MCFATMKMMTWKRQIDSLHNAMMLSVVSIPKSSGVSGIDCSCLLLARKQAISCTQSQHATHLCNHDLGICCLRNDNSQSTPASCSVATNRIGCLEINLRSAMCSVTTKCELSTPTCQSNHNIMQSLACLTFTVQTDNWCALTTTTFGHVPLRSAWSSLHP